MTPMELNELEMKLNEVGIKLCVVQPWIFVLHNFVLRYNGRFCATDISPKHSTFAGVRRTTN